MILSSDSKEIWIVNISDHFENKPLVKEAPLALMYLSGALKQKGFKTRIWDLLEDEVDIFLREAAKAEIMFIAMSCTFGLWAPLTRDLAVKIKKVRPEIPIIVGGINVTCCPEPFLRESCFDFLGIGEGERTIQEFADAVMNGKNFKKIPGLAFLKDGKPVYTMPRERVTDIDQFPMDLEGVDLNPYIETLLDGTRVLKNYQTSRGCPFSCSFCYNSVTQKRLWRCHGLDYILEDIQYLKSRYKFSSIQLADDHFFVDRKRAFELMERLYEMGIILQGVEARASDLLDKELFENLRRYECRVTLIGFESENPRLLDLMNKKMSPEVVEKALEIGRAYPEISIFAHVILGLPTHTWKEITDTIRYMIKKMEEYENFLCHVSVYMPIPGSVLYNTYRDLGLPEFKRIEEFAQIGVGTTRKHSMAFGLRWLDMSSSKRIRIRKSVKLSRYYMQTLFVKRNFKGIIKLINEFFYLTGKYRFISLRTGFMMEAVLFGFITKIYQYLLNKGWQQLPAGLKPL